MTGTRPNDFQREEPLKHRSSNCSRKNISVHRPGGKEVGSGPLNAAGQILCLETLTGRTDTHVLTEGLQECPPCSSPPWASMLAQHPTQNSWAAPSLSAISLPKKALRVSITGAWDLVPWASLTGGDLFEGLVSWRIHVFTPRSPASVLSP